MEALREECRVLMRDRGLTITELAHQLSVGRSTLSQWLSGKEPNPLPGVRRAAREWVRRVRDEREGLELQRELGHGLIVAFEEYRRTTGHEPRSGWLHELWMQYKNVRDAAPSEREAFWANWPTRVRSRATR